MRGPARAANVEELQTSKKLLVTPTYKLVAKKGRKNGGDCGNSPFFNKAMV
jgi:hypothetical protein